MTGAVHQFRFQLDPLLDKDFYPRVPINMLKLKIPPGSPLDGLSEVPLCASDREDTLGYISWYIRYAYWLLGRQRFKEASPYDDLLVMFKFWQEGFNQQDTKVICLEIEQKFLFDV